MPLPSVQLEILETIKAEMEKDPDGWVNRCCEKLEIAQPILTIYLKCATDFLGEQAVLTGLFIYKTLEAQMEVNELEK